MAGRPTKYSKELTDKICQRLAHGETLLKICLDPEMPERASIYNWLDKHKAFFDKYAHARNLQADWFADEIVQIADEAQFDMTADGDGKPVVNWEHIQRSKLKIDARKWHASKTAPKKYGDFQRTEVTGADGAAQKIEYVISDKALTDIEFEATLKAASTGMGTPAGTAEDAN